MASATDDTFDSVISLLYPNATLPPEVMDLARGAVGRVLSPQLMRSHVEISLRNAMTASSMLRSRAISPKMDEIWRFASTSRALRVLGWIGYIVHLPGVVFPHFIRLVTLLLRPSIKLDYPPVTMALLVLHMLSYIAQDAFASFQQAIVLSREEYLVLGEGGSVERRQRVWKGQAHRYITHLFGRGKNDMDLVLAAWGPIVESAFGPARFGLFYLAAGVAAGVLSPATGVRVGAHGAVSGLLGAGFYVLQMVVPVIDWRAMVSAVDWRGGLKLAGLCLLAHVVGYALGAWVAGPALARECYSEGIKGIWRQVKGIWRQVKAKFRWSQDTRETDAYLGECAIGFITGLVAAYICGVPPYDKRSWEWMEGW